MRVLRWSSREVAKFRSALGAWYAANRRELPWRGLRDPYRIWISEIMLQQTRVAAVIPYYEKFLSRFPTVRHLARAREATVLAAWSGLGYYRRARMMHRAAKQVVADFGGNFPHTYDELRSLPGIGPYTAAAIASIAFDIPRAVVDGNVERVLGRINGAAIDRAQTWKAAELLIDPTAPGDHNQAMMELGAMICTPKSPRCADCPVIDSCATRGEEAKKAREIRNQKSVAYGLARRNGSVFLVQRAHDASLMAGMWELPQLPRAPRTSPLMTVRHAITTTDYTVAVHAIGGAKSVPGKWVPLASLSRLALTGLTRKVLRRAEALV